VGDTKQQSIPSKTRPVYEIDQYHQLKSMYLLLFP
jgi:hypothetical protein